MTRLINCVASIRALRTLDELILLAPEWVDLCRRCPDATPFQRPEWLLPWIEVVKPDGLTVIEVRENGRLIGLAPLLIYPRGAEKVLAFTGGGVSDYLNLLLEPGRELPALAAIFEAVERELGWTLLELTDLPANSSLCRHPELKHNAARHDSCLVTRLPQSREELLHQLSHRQRANLRNARSRLQRAGGGDVEIATADTLTEFLQELFQLHTSRWSAAGEPGVLHDDRVRQFHRLSSPELLQAGLLRIYRLRVQNRTAAVIYSLWERRTVYCYLQGFDPDFAFISPGTLLMFSVMEDAVKAGMLRFDFLRGAEAYKQHWRPQVEDTLCVSVSRPKLPLLRADDIAAA